MLAGAGKGFGFCLVCIARRGVVLFLVQGFALRRPNDFAGRRNKPASAAQRERRLFIKRIFLVEDFTTSKNYDGLWAFCGPVTDTFPSVSGEFSDSL